MIRSLIERVLLWLLVRVTKVGAGVCGRSHLYNLLLAFVCLTVADAEQEDKMVEQVATLAYSDKDRYPDEVLFALKKATEGKLATATMMKVAMASFIASFGDVPGFEGVVAAVTEAVETYNFCVRKYTAIIIVLTAELTRRGFTV